MPLAFRDAGRQRGLVVPSNFAGGADDPDAHRRRATSGRAIAVRGSLSITRCSPMAARLRYRCFKRHTGPACQESLDRDPAAISHF